jgi:hypothetical protein
MGVMTLVLLFGGVGQAEAQRRRAGKKRPVATEPAPPAPTAKPTPKGKTKGQVFDFTAMELGGRMRTPQLLYFLDRAQQELDRAALEKRSFLPEMTRSLAEAPL